MKAVLFCIAAAIAGVFIFHAVHHRLYCRYRKVPGKSHCAKCGHRRTCQKYHRKLHT